MSKVDQVFLNRHATMKGAIRGFNPATMVASSARHKHTIKDVREGGFIRFGGKTFRVDGISTYVEMTDGFKRDKAFSWQELTLFCLENGQTSYLEWEEDDKIKIHLTVANLSFRDLRDDEDGAIDEDDLDALCDDGEAIFCKGFRFDYDDDYAARYVRGGRGREKKKGSKAYDKVYFYEFALSGGDSITIEEWTDGEDEDYEVFLSRPLQPSEIEIISLGGKK